MQRTGKATPWPKQDVLLTVPARLTRKREKLTWRAAEQAGLQRVTLLEEPQAAFLRMAREPGGWVAQAHQGWGPGPGLRRRRWNHRLQPDRGFRKKMATWR